jgi:Fe2+ transport system protein FeoA
LTELGLVPESDVEVVTRAPFGGPITVRTRNGENAISRELADRIHATES